MQCFAASEVPDDYHYSVCLAEQKTDKPFEEKTKFKKERRYRRRFQNMF